MQGKQRTHALSIHTPKEQIERKNWVFQQLENRARCVQKGECGEHANADSDTDWREQKNFPESERACEKCETGQSIYSK